MNRLARAVSRGELGVAKVRNWGKLRLDGYRLFGLWCFDE